MLVNYVTKEIKYVAFSHLPINKNLRIVRAVWLRICWGLNHLLTTAGSGSVPGSGSGLFSGEFSLGAGGVVGGAAGAW